MSFAVAFDPADGQRLLAEYEQAMASYRNANHYVRPPSDAELREWLWDHRATLVRSALDLHVVELQLQQRDRVIIDLLKTLAETEARLLTRKPDALP